MTDVYDLKDAIERADALRKERKLDEALPVYLEVIANVRNPADQRLRYIYGRALYCSSRLRDWQKTEAVAREALAHFPAFAAAYQYLGEAFLAKGDRAAAKEALEKAIVLNPLQRDARNLLKFAVSNESKSIQKQPRPWPKRQAPFSDPIQLIRKYLVDERNTEKFITPETRFMTLGSCFATNLAERLKAAGYKTHVEPVGEDLNSTFANRYLLEWVERGPVNAPTSTMQEIYGAALRSRLREAIENSDVMVLTLGVAPCFFHADTGEFSPIVAKSWSAVKPYVHSSHIMRTTTVSENIENLNLILQTLQRVCRKDFRAVLTVSPVPLGGTTEFASAIVADCLSKSTLRLACEEVLRTWKDRNVIYWPSFEIVRWLGPHYGKELPPVYGADDGASRHVSQWLVKIIIDEFLSCYAGSPSIAAPAAGLG